MGIGLNFSITKCLEFVDSCFERKFKLGFKYFEKCLGSMACKQPFKMPTKFSSGYSKHHATVNQAKITMSLLTSIKLADQSYE